MDESELTTRLSRISTSWSLVRAAHRDEDASQAARNQLMERYHRVAYRYLLAALRNPDTADEAFQEFALRFARGDFRRADPGRGRFRQYVKTVLINLARRFQRTASSKAPQLDELDLEPVAEPTADSAGDELFLASWREELLARAWEELRGIEEGDGQPFFSVLRIKSGSPHLSSAELAAELATARTTDPLSEAAVRKLVQRARGRFAEILFGEVSRSLEDPPLNRLEEELIDLNLLSYCRSAIDRRRA